MPLRVYHIQLVIQLIRKVNKFQNIQEMRQYFFKSKGLCRRVSLKTINYFKILGLEKSLVHFMDYLDS